MTSTTIEMTKSFTLSDKAVIDILDGAFEGGINYWASQGSYDKDNRTFYVKEDDFEGEAQEFNLTFADLVTAAASLTMPNAPVNSDIRMAILGAFEDYDTADLDADAYDCIVQFACFGDLVYG